jgi:hypothetical protein
MLPLKLQARGDGEGLGDRVEEGRKSSNSCANLTANERDVVLVSVIRAALPQKLRPY